MNMPPTNGLNGAGEDRTKSVSLRAFLTRLVWLCMLPLLVLATFLAIDRVQKLRTQFDESASDLAHNVAMAVDNYLRAQITTLEAMAVSPLLDDPPRLHELYIQAQRLVELYGSPILLADKSSRTIFNTRAPFGTALPKLPLPKGFAAVPYVLETGKPAVGDTFYGSVAMDQLIAVVVPVIRHEQIRFLLLCPISTTRFQQIIDEMALPKEWSVTITDSIGNVISSRGPPTHEDQGNSLGCFMEKSRISPWNILVHVPTIVYMAPVIWSVGMMILVLFAAIVAGILGGRRAGSGLSRSVEALSALPLPQASRPLITDIEDVRSRLTGAILARDMADASRLEVEQRFRRLFDATPMPICFIKRDGSFGELNHAFTVALGYSKEDVPTLGEWKDVSPPDRNHKNGVIKRWQDVLSEALTQESDITPTECLVNSKDGEVLTVLTSGVMMGEGFLCASLDITERKEAEKSLRDSEERFRILAEGAFVGVVISREEIFLDFNEEFTRIAGYTLDELVGAKLLDVVDPRFHEIVTQHVISNSAEAYEAAIVHKNGRIIPVLIEGRFIPYEGGIARLSAIRDITNEKRAQELQNRLATAITQAGEGVFITDPEGIIQYVNPAVERISGFPAEEIVGQTPRVFRSGMHDSSFYRDLWETIKSGRTWSGRITNRRKDGKLSHQDSTISPVKDASGKIINFVAVNRDVTEYLELTKQLFQSQKMESIGTLTGGIAHDFNNILQVCLGYSELLAESKDMPRDLMDDALNINAAAKRGADLAHRLLTFSRKTEINPIQLNLNQRIDEMGKMLARTIPKNIGIHLILAEDLSSILADPIQMDQVIMNIVVNARDAMPDGGKLTIETANIFLDDEYARKILNATPGDYVMLRLTDTGIGMDEQTMSRIFEPFYTTKEPGRGTGLGLAVVFGIVHQHKGFIRYYSQPGLGTTCKIYFPALISSEEANSIAVSEMPKGGTETVLVVDDDDQIRDYLSRILGRSGYSVIMAQNGNEALDVFTKRKETISLILLDLIMPEMDGAQCLQELLRIDPSVKVVMVSGFSAEGKISHIIKTGAKAFISKPFVSVEVLNKIRDVIDSETLT